MLILPIKKKWFDMILSGEKKEEYREITPYWRARLTDPEPQAVILRNEYGKDAPEAMVALHSITIGEGFQEWGAEPGTKYFRLHIKEAKLIKEG